MRTLTTAADVIGYYGPKNREGVLAEHLHLFTADGGTVRPAASGSGLEWAVLDGVARPVLCGAIVAWWQTDEEDGFTERVEGRCGADATDEGACPGHAAERDAWRDATEAERIAWERAQEF